MQEKKGNLKTSDFVKKARKDLRSAADEKTKENFQRFFKEPVRGYGVRAAVVDKIAAKYWKEISLFSKKKIFGICEELFASDYAEEAAVAAFYGKKFGKFTELKDLAVFKRWVSRYINNWAKCDSFCNHTLGDFIQKFPEALPEVKSWAGSKNRWMRRASAVSLILPARRGKLLKDVFEIVDVLLQDKEDMVQKGYGWLLKEASRLHTKEVFDYIMEKKAVMPRTALRYAIELMPRDLKIKAMDR